MILTDSEPSSDITVKLGRSRHGQPIARGTNAALALLDGSLGEVREVASRGLEARLNSYRYTSSLRRVSGHFSNR